jgi:hypothetical protein
MQAIGWRVVASLHDGEPVHVLEYGPADTTAYRKSARRAGLIQSRASKSGPDFWAKTSLYLHDQGLSEEVYPQRGRAERDRVKAIRA